MCTGSSWKVKTASLRCFRHGAGLAQPFSLVQPSSAGTHWPVCSAPRWRQLRAGSPGPTWLRARPPAEGSTARTTQPFQTRHSCLAIQAPAHKPQGSRSYRALAITYVTFSFDARVRQIEKLKAIIITANERGGGSSAEQLQGPLGQKQRARGTACARCHHDQLP